MRSKIAEKIISETPQEVRDAVRAYGDSVVRKEELRKEFDIKFCYLTNEANFKTMITPADVFDWFYSKLEAKDKECAAKIAAGERLRMEDAMSAINEANGLREKIKEQELIIYGIEEGAEQWKSLCAELIQEQLDFGVTLVNSRNQQITDLKAKLEADEGEKLQFIDHLEGCLKQPIAYIGNVDYQKGYRQSITDILLRFKPKV